MSASGSHAFQTRTRVRLLQPMDQTFFHHFGTFSQKLTGRTNKGGDTLCR